MIASEVAKLAGVSTDVVRYYSRIGLINPTRNPDNGYRIYTPPRCQPCAIYQEG